MVETSKAIFRTLCRLTVFFFLTWVAGCDSASRELHEALNLAGDNRPELQKALDYFSDDPLKREACEFLIRNMPGHYSYGGEFLEDFRESITQPEARSPYFREMMASVLYQDKRAKEYLDEEEDIKKLTGGFLIRHIERRFEQWETCPWLAGITFEDFCHYVLPYRFRDGPAVLPDELFISEEENEAILTRFDDINHAAWKISQLYFPKDYQLQVQLPPPFEASPLLDCYLLGFLRMYYFRAAAIPSAFDFVPAWAATNGQHYWANVIDVMQKRGSYEETLPQKPPKVYRYSYVPERRLPDVEAVPDFFRNPFLQDVTAEYVHAVEVELPIPPSCRRKLDYACLAVFNNRGWVPVACEKVKAGKVRFMDMGAGCVYLLLGYMGGEAHALSAPFILKRDGGKEFLQVDKNASCVLDLKRKYHYNSQAVGGKSMVGTLFECSNDADFRQSKLFYQVERNHHMDRQQIACPEGAYRYWRIRPRVACALAELDFLDVNGNPVDGRIVEMDCEGDGRLLFDGDPLTCIQSYRVFDFEFDEPVALGYICYLPMNDGNGIYPGNEYELFYFDRGAWQSCGCRVALADSVTYKNVPSGGLYWLRNRTTGTQERIFTYENGKMKFW